MFWSRACTAYRITAKCNIAFNKASVPPKNSTRNSRSSRVPLCKFVLFFRVDPDSDDRSGNRGMKIVTLFDSRQKRRRTTEGSLSLSLFFSEKLSGTTSNRCVRAGLFVSFGEIANGFGKLIKSQRLLALDRTVGQKSAKSISKIVSL